MIKTETPDTEWKSLLDKRGLTADFPFEIEELEPLKQKLLSIGGWAVILPAVEEDLQTLLQKGRKFPATWKMMKGSPNQCHMNSACLWEENKDKVKICTGFALSRDGVWRQHSWCVQKIKNSYKTIETTVWRCQYYGFIMSDEQASDFFFNNL